MTARMVKMVMMLAVALIAGVLLQSKFQWKFPWIESVNVSESAADKKMEPEVLYWVAPMDPNFRRDKPGKSPMGMDLVPVYADEGTRDSRIEVRISPEVENNLGVRTALVERGPIWRMIKATGTVDFDASLMSHVHVRTPGWVQRLTISSEGDEVEAGQLLFELYSPELVNAQKEYLQARRRADPDMTDAAAEKLRALGMIDSDILALKQRGSPADTIQVVAPRAGVVTALSLVEGMHVMPATHAVSLADLSRVWVHADVVESQADWVRPKQAAEVRLNYLPGEVIEGVVDYVYPVLDPKTRTVKVRLRFDNPAQRLKPNMFGRVVIYGGARRDVLSIPREALIRSGESDRVVVSLGNGRFRSQQVIAGIESGEWVEVRNGLEAGDRIVTSAQFLIDSEASIAGSIRRLDASSQ